MITQELFQSASLAILLLVSIARTFIPSYLKKKGENLATKEDIAHITKQIEQVKSRFDIEKEIQKSFIFEQKECLLKFYDTITEFHYECLAINFGEFPQDKGESLFEYQKNFRIKITEILKGYQRLVVYLEQDNNLLKFANEVVKQSLDTNNVMKTKFYNIKKSSIHESIAYSESLKSGNNDEYHKAVTESDTANKEFWEAMRPIVIKYVEAYQQYLTLLNSHLTPKQNAIA